MIKMGNPPNTMGLTERQITNFLTKINKMPGGCWLWVGGKTNLGYGKVNINGKTCLAHRVSFELFKGSIDASLKLDHFYCKTRHCVNPDHLEEVTQRTNVLRGASYVAGNAARTHCPKGHPYDEANTIPRILPNGQIGRRCKACRTIHEATHKQKLMAATK